MKILIKKKDISVWLDITSYINFPIIFNDTVDGTFDTMSLELFTPKKIGYLNTANPIPTKYQVKYTTAENEEDENEDNTRLYYINESNSARKSKEILDENGDVVKDALYIHRLECIENISILDDRYLPNYTITQPKSQYYSTYNRTSGVRFNVDYKAKQDGRSFDLPRGQEFGLASMNNDGGEISYGYDSKGHYVQFNEIDKTSFSSNFKLNLTKTAAGQVKTTQFLLIPKTTYVGVADSDEIYKANKSSVSLNNVNFIIEYRDNVGNIIQTNEKRNTIRYSGNLVEARTDFLGDVTLINFPNFSSDETIITIPRSDFAKSVRIYYTLPNQPKEYNYAQVQVLTSVFNTILETDIQGFDNDGFNKVWIENLTINSTTGVYNTEIKNKKQTILGFLEKVLFDYNLNSRDKIELSEEVKPLLDVEAKESEWGNYTLRELLERTFKYVGIKPKLNLDNSIGYKISTNVPYSIDLNTEEGQQSEQVGEDNFDKIVNNAKNLVSQEDFVREILPLVSVDTEFSQITDDNGGFVTSNDIYFVSSAILYTPNLNLDFGTGGIINTNMGKPYYWDITERLFEEDIYNSFPNVRMDFVVPPQDPIASSYFSLLSQGNTISYKSGSNYIKNIFKQAENVPEYDWKAIVSSGSTVVPNPEYAIIEMLIMLGATQVPSIGSSEPKPDVLLRDIVKYELDLTYCPIYKELTTKFTSNMSIRKGLNYEKRVNNKEKTISYQDNEKVLRSSMEMKGNTKHLFNTITTNIDETIPVNSIINNKYYITSKVMSVRNNIVETDYSLQENFMLQNEDIRLPVSFERYAVPYEYVSREVMLENHLIFSKTKQTKYLNETVGCGVQFIRQNFLNNGIDGTLYGKMEIDENLYLMRFSKLKTNFTMILSGTFLDNYSAGVQRYNGTDDKLYYTQPYRYTDGNGKVENVSNLEIGYSSGSDVLRLKRYFNSDYDIKMFPAGTYGGLDVNLDIKMINANEVIMLEKDAREKISITHTSYLQNETDDIKMFNFGVINKIGALIDDVELKDDLNLIDIVYEDHDEDMQIILVEENNNTFKFMLSAINISKFNKGIVLINSNNGVDTLIGVIKEPVIEQGRIVFYTTSNRYGFIDDEFTSVIIDIDDTQTIKMRGL